MSAPSAQKSAASPPAKLVTLGDDDLAELAKFVAAQSRRSSAIVEPHLRWLLLENPARHAQIPLGCGMRSPQGDLVGCILYVPQIFRFQRQTFLVLGSSSFYVDERYRGSGGLIFLRFSEVARKWPLFGNSANVDSASLWRVRGAVPIPNSDQELLAVLRLEGVIEETLQRRGLQKTVARSISGPAALFVQSFKRLKLEGGRSDNLRPLSSAEEVMQLPIYDSAPEVTANRDLSYIRWRYFSGHDATVAVFAFRSPQVASDILVTVNQRNRGYREQVRTLNVLDIYPVVSSDVHASIVAALVDRYRGQVDAIVLRGMDEARQDSFRRLGFVRRGFEAPSGWLLDKSGIAPNRPWYTVPADGDLAI